MKGGEDMRRRVMDVVYKVPKLVKLSENPGTERTYTLERGYRYIDLLVVGGGGGGGYNSGGGGGSGTMLYVRNLIVSKLKNTTIRYNIAGESGLQEDGKNTVVVIDGFSVNVPGGKRGISHGGEGGDGGSLLPQSSIDALLKYVDNNNDIAVCSNGGGCGGSWNATEGIADSGSSGASVSSDGESGRSGSPGSGKDNTDGTGGHRGGDSRTLSGGTGQRRNDTVIPISSVLGGGGKSGSGERRELGVSSGSGGGAAGYQSGGNGGAMTGSSGQNGGIGSGGGGGGGGNGPGSKGGQGVICLYYHN